MGIITRSAANNITTGGVILPTAINDASVASVTALAQVSAEDGITLISSQTASASASLSFTTGIDSTYRTYMFKFINIHPSSDAVSLSFNFSIDGGSNYNVTKTSTQFRSEHDEGGSSGTLVYRTANDLAQGTGYQRLGDDTGNGNDECCSGYLHLFNPSSTTFVKHFMSANMEYNSANRATNCYAAGYGNTTSAINAVDFKFSSGNIDAGTIYMYGIA